MGKVNRIFLLILLVLALALPSIDPTIANPYIHDRKMEGTIPPPTGTKPPVITVISPKNQSVYSTNNLALNFNTTIEPSNNLTLMIDQVSYRCSWHKDKDEIDMLSLFVKNNYSWPSTFSINLTDIPNGPHSIEISATARGPAYNTRVETQGIYQIQYYVAYAITSTVSIDLTIGNNTSVSTPTPAETYLPPNNRNAPHLDPMVYLIPVSIIVAVVVLSVLLYSRHRKTTKSSEQKPLTKNIVKKPKML